MSGPRLFHAYWRPIMRKGTHWAIDPLFRGWVPGWNRCTVTAGVQAARLGWRKYCRVEKRREPGPTGSVVLASHSRNKKKRGIRARPRARFQKSGERHPPTNGQHVQQGVPRSLAEPHHSSLQPPMCRSNPEGSPISKGL